MRVFLLGKSNPILYYRPELAITTAMSIVDPNSGSIINTPTVSQDLTDADVTSIARGATSIVATGLVKGRKYILTETSGPFTTEIQVVSVNGTSCALRRPIPVAVGAAKVQGILSSASYTPASINGRYVIVQFTLSDGTVEREQALVVTKQAVIPITLDHLFSRYPRIRGQEPTEQIITGEGWRPQVQDAWDRVRDAFLEHDIYIDEVVNSAILKELSILHCGKILSEMGLSPSGFQDRAEERRYFNSCIDSEMTQLLNNKLLLDTTHDNVPEEVAHGSWRFGWDA